MGNRNSSKEDEFDPYEGGGRGKSKSVHVISEPTLFKAGIKIQYDENGKIKGMPELWVDLLELSPEMIAYQVSMEELDENVKPEMPSESIISKIKTIHPGKFTVYMKGDDDGEEEEGKWYDVEVDENTSLGMRGLPEQWKKELKESNLTKEDVKNNPKGVLEMLDSLQRTKSRSVYPLPTNSEYRKLEEKSIVFTKTNPQDDYIILQVLGEGGFGKVYKTVQIEDGQFYAMKMIDITSNKQKIYIGNEITIMKTIDHKNIVKLYDTYMYQGRIFMFMEFLDGGCLTPIVEELTEPIPEPVIAFILRETLEGLAQLHKRGIIHRDIKSDNILISKFDSSIKITDFGYSCQLTQEKRLRESRVGTLYWMAPEVIKGAELYDERCDIWSLGVFAFELAEGVPPFPKKGQQRTIYNILTKPPPTLKNKDKWSEEFNSFIETWMVKDPKERPTSAELLKHPFVNDFDYDEYKQEYLNYKEKVLRELKVISEDEEAKFETLDNKSTRTRSKTVKQLNK